MLNSKEFSLSKIQIGHLFTPLIYPISRELIYKYAQAVGDLNPLYLNSPKVASGPFQGMIAPPTIASLFVLKAYRTDSPPPPGGIHLKQKFRFYGPMRPGDMLSVQAELTQKEKIKGNWHLTFTIMQRIKKEKTWSGANPFLYGLIRKLILKRLSQHVKKP